MQEHDTPDREENVATRAHGSELCNCSEVAGWEPKPRFRSVVRRLRYRFHPTPAQYEPTAAPAMGPDRYEREPPMSLWTPDGEVPVDRSGAKERPATSASEMLGGPNLDDLSPEERAQAEQMIAQMAEVQRQLMSHPASVFVANHLMGLYELAAVHLDQAEPKYEEVRLAIDAMTSMLDATEDRLGESGSELRQALTVLQTVYVQRVNATKS